LLIIIFQFIFYLKPIPNLNENLIHNIIVSGLLAPFAEELLVKGMREGNGAFRKKKGQDE
jgi:hypothetical protein